MSRTPSWPGLLLNRQFLLARLRRAFLQDSPTPGGSLCFAHRGHQPSTQTHAESVQGVLFALIARRHCEFRACLEFFFLIYSALWLAVLSARSVPPSDSVLQNRQ